jgi:hypothetical protein
MDPTYSLGAYVLVGAFAFFLLMALVLRALGYESEEED